jgi:putative transposase
MKAASPDKEWWTASEIAEARLPVLPNTQRGVDFLGKKNGWRKHPNLARRREGRGGGWEYHWHLFPLEARLVQAILKPFLKVIPIRHGMKER